MPQPYTLSVQKVAKRFNKTKLFNDIDFQLISGDKLAITGTNGSGKSTLLKIIAGIIPPSKGKVNVLANDKEVSKEAYFKHFNICAPYIELIEEFSLREHLAFHQNFKEPLFEDGIEEIVKEAGLLPHLDQKLNSFSSGMKQRVKLILAICYNSTVMMLDEPTSHLDEAGKNWYKKLLNTYSNERICILFSNETEEYIFFTKKMVNIEP